MPGIIFILSLFLATGCVAPDAKETGTLELNLTNIRSSDGEVFVFVYNYENQYPENPFRHYVFDKHALHTDSMAVTLTELPHGDYSIAIFDDENGNEEMDKFLGLPTEGYGFSNGARPKFVRLPSFYDCLVTFNLEQRRHFIELRYFI